MMTMWKNSALAVGVIGFIGLAAGQAAARPREIKVPAGAAIEVKVPDPPAAKPRDAVQKQDRETAALALQARVNRPLGTNVMFEPFTPVREALGFLSDKFDISMVIDESAFQTAEGKIDVGVLPVTLATLRNPSLRTVLRLLLAQIPDGAYYIHSDYVEITTGKRIRSEVLHTQEQPGRLWPPPIHASFARRPLQEVLNELADLAGVNIVLDARVGDKARTEVTARLSNVAIETAVQLLADMADLHPVTIENVIYVTTGPNAERLLAQQQKRKQAKPEEKKIEKKEEPAKPEA
jgi:hypothetical protein